MSDKMNMRENFLSVMSFKKAERLPFVEWASWWNKTIDRWKTEGLPEKLSLGTDIMEYFGLDIVQQYWFNPRVNGPRPAYHGSGILTDMTMQGYKELRSSLFPADCVTKSKESIKKWVKKQQDGDALIWITLEGFFWFPREIMGIQNHLYAFYDEPELIHMMNEDLLNFNKKVLDEFCELCIPDFMSFAEDMSYNKGPMISKSLFDEFLSPYYEKIIKKVNDYNILMFVDTDGDVTELIPWFYELGITGFLPLERQAGVDLCLIRQRHPNLRLLGGFDKTVMHLGEEAIRKEFERLSPIIKQGGFIPSVDHQTPPNVSLEDYKIYAKLLKEYCSFKEA